MKKRQVLYKNPFDTYFDMTLFSYRCPEFTFSIFYRNYFNPNGTLSKNIDIPDPVILEDFFCKFADKGLLSPLFSLPCVDFRLTHGIDVWSHDSFAGDIVVCAAPLRFYIGQRGKVGTVRPSLPPVSKVSYSFQMIRKGT